MEIEEGKKRKIIRNNSKTNDADEEGH